MNEKGFSLTELLIYIAIVAIISGFLVGILTTSTRVEVQQRGVIEVSNQLNFVLQTIQRLVRESSAIMVNCSLSESVKDNDIVDIFGECGALPQGTSLVGSPQPVLRLRMIDSAGRPTDRDPIVIWKEIDGTIKMRQGISQTESDLTTQKAQDLDNSLTFTKFTNYPGHDVVEISFTLSYNTTNPQAEFKKSLTTAVSRVSTAIFDDSILPDASNLDFGTGTNLWRNLYLANFKIEDGKIFQPENYGVHPDGEERGTLVVIADSTQNCFEVCGEHTGSCAMAMGIIIDPQNGGLGGFIENCPTRFDTVKSVDGTDKYPNGGFCFCN